MNDDPAARPANRLGSQTSPYLLQHAHNPVHWFPWGEEALSLARAQDKPIFLSIGYAACHWCHVMERESFEDEDTAALMNEHFVSIKVDREERPDLDGIYMDAVQAMNGHGGWPLSAFLTPDGAPFYAGTYFPPEPSHGMPAFRQVLRGIAEAWRDRRDDLAVQAGRITEAIARTGLLEGSGATLDAAIGSAALQRLRDDLDPRWGGFGGAPKFPQPMTLEFVLRQAVRDVPGAREMIVLTLDRMAEGGMYDQLGGGFARYSTDAAWHVPHFEKMLYDNAQLLRLYTRAWQVTGFERYARVVRGTADYLLREMRDDAGGFWSSQDADSEGVEGRFFTWTWDELMAVVDEPVAACLGATPQGNWSGEATNVLWRPVPVAEVAATFGIDAGELAASLAEGTGRLFAIRDQRVHPGTDDKVLTAWNAMAIEALAEAGRVLDETRYLDAAVACGTFVLSELRDDDGGLMRSWRRGRAGGPGFADDHALVASACLTLYETTFSLPWFEAARSLADVLLDRFVDAERGGFFQTSRDGEALLVRPKDLYDNAAPGGNSAAADALLRLAALTGETRYADAATASLGLVGEVLGRAPTAFGLALCALDRYVGPGHEVAVVGDPRNPATRALAHEVTGAAYRPNVVLAVAAPGDTASAEAVALLRDRGAIDGHATAYVCERFACRLPVTDRAALAAQLAAP